MTPRPSALASAPPPALRLRWWPGSLFGRLILILLSGLAVAHALSLALIVYERAEAARDVMFYYVGRDVASSVAILERLPAAERPAWLERLARANYHYKLDAVTTATTSSVTGAAARAATGAATNAVTGAATSSVTGAATSAATGAVTSAASGSVTSATTAAAPTAPATAALATTAATPVSSTHSAHSIRLPEGVSAQLAQAIGAALGGHYVVRAETSPPSRLDLHLTLADGAALTVTLTPSGLTFSPRLPYLLLLQLAILSACTWFAVRLATRPLAQLARAADAIRPDLGRRLDAAPYTGLHARPDSSLYPGSNPSRNSSLYPGSTPSRNTGLYPNSSQDPNAGSYASPNASPNSSPNAGPHAYPHAAPFTGHHTSFVTQPRKRATGLPEASALPETGPDEVVRATVAFNAMQARIAGHLGERMQILAAVSHDLQTPITRMRLRADLLDDCHQRDKMLADLSMMQALVEEGIAYARDAHGVAEAPCRTDIDSMLASLVYDYQDAGQQVRFTGQLGHPLTTCPHALRRIVGNLLDNALKFGSDVVLAIHDSPADGVTITVSDRGPGLAVDQLDAVFEPFYRVEASRNRATGGAGLGLAIVRQLATALGAHVSLANREGGGLEARVWLAPSA